MHAWTKRLLLCHARAAAGRGENKKALGLSKRLEISRTLGAAREWGASPRRITCASNRSADDRHFQPRGVRLGAGRRAVFQRAGFLPRSRRWQDCAPCAGEESPHKPHAGGRLPTASGLTLACHEVRSCEGVYQGARTKLRAPAWHETRFCEGVYPCQGGPWQTLPADAPE